jgi:hypothetical protein
VYTTVSRECHPERSESFAKRRSNGVEGPLARVRCKQAGQGILSMSSKRHWRIPLRGTGCARVKGILRLRFGLASRSQILAQDDKL